MDRPIYFSELLVPDGFKGKTITFENKSLIIVFAKVNDELISLPFAPWGSFHCYSAAEYDFFQVLVHKIKGFCRENGVTKVVIKHPPRIYDHSIPSKWLEQEGFEAHNEINQHIDLQNEVALHSMENRKLRKLTKVYRVQQLNITQKYDLIKEWRDASAIPLNIEKSHLLGLFSKLPMNFEYWGIENDQQIVSVCVCIKVTKSIVYYFLPATNPAHRSESPMVLLLHELCKHYQTKGFSVFDLGQSSIDGVPQEGLIQFKKRMGAISTEKTTFSLSL